ncbi:MAG: hypothetical protein V4507_09460 [Verrucomicrobiota bacterium]
MFEDKYLFFLAVHNLWRWIALGTGIVSVVVSIRGLLSSSSFRPSGRIAGILYVAAMDIQLLLGFILYGISPLLKLARAHFSLAMKRHELRFFAVEHITLMLLALVLVHIGSVRSKRALTDRLKFRQLLIWNSASLVMILFGIPWWRPLFRSFTF